MMPSVPGQPILDLRLPVQLLNKAAITITSVAAKNNLFITFDFWLKECYYKLLYYKCIILVLNGEIGQILHIMVQANQKTKLFLHPLSKCFN